MDEQRTFRETVWHWYAQHGRRDLPWRQPNAHGLFDPYAILVSELMLQQTQVARVIPKYQQFLQTFPSVEVLAQSDLGAVLRRWQGLGYNRRAKFLWQSAGMIVAEYDATVPHAVGELTKLPGVGINTAGAIRAYAFDQPSVFVETNIRTVYIHHFFADREGITDGEIRAVAERMLPTDESPREWYWALMDYGTILKQSIGNPNIRSAAYAKQSTFQGSKRQLRGAILRAVADGSKTLTELESLDDERIPGVVTDLVREGLVRKLGGRYLL